MTGNGDIRVGYYGGLRFRGRFRFTVTVTVTTAVELSVEWLWEIREKLLAHEYLVLLATFVAIQIVGLNKGLIVGVGFSTLFFVISYASERRCCGVLVAVGVGCWDRFCSAHNLLSCIYLVALDLIKGDLNRWAGGKK